MCCIIDGPILADREYQDKDTYALRILPRDSFFGWRVQEMELSQCGKSLGNEPEVAGCSYALVCIPLFVMCFPGIHCAPCDKSILSVCLIQPDATSNGSYAVMHAQKCTNQEGYSDYVFFFSDSFFFFFPLGERMFCFNI